MASQGPCPIIELIDVLETPGLCQQVYDRLDRPARLAVRHCCRSIRQQVEQCVETLTFEMLDRHRTPEQMHASMRQLATSRLSPKKISITCRLEHGCAQYFASPEYRHVWSKVQVLNTKSGCYEELIQVLAPSMPLLQDLTFFCRPMTVPGPPLSCHWPAVFTHTPRLHTLTLLSTNPPPDALLAALQNVPSLRSLNVYGDSYTLLAQLTQLQALTLVHPIIDKHMVAQLKELQGLLALHSQAQLKHQQPAQGIPVMDDSMMGIQTDESGPDVLSQLTGLTSLEISGTPRETPHTWQAQLATALSAMHQLRRLSLPEVWPGPVAQALSQMQQLTELDICSPCRPTAGLVLPGVQVLRVVEVDLSFLDSLVAPKLQVLQGGVGSTINVQPYHLNAVSLDIDESDPPFQQAAVLERCMQGVMRHCNHLELCFPHQLYADDPPSELDSGRAAVVTSVVQILSRCWRPDPHLVDGSSPLNPLRLAGGHNAPAASASCGWGLTLCSAVVTSSIVAALPQSLTYIHLRRCQIDADALEPLAQLPNLRELVLNGSLTHLSQAIVQLLSSAIQGRFLKVTLSENVCETVIETVTSAQATLRAERGSRGVPQLEVVRRSCAEDDFNQTVTVTLH